MTFGGGSFGGGTGGTQSSLTLLSLAREVSRRNDDLALSTPSSGTTTSLVDQTLLQSLPQSTTQFFAYVYGVQANTDGNAGLERRAIQWSTSNWTLTLSAPGFPSPIGSSGQTYEIRFRDAHDRVVEAINDGIGELDFACLREVKDESLTGVQTQWRYTLPATQNWAEITKVEIQTNLVFADFPYMPAEQMGLVWRAEKTTDTLGNEVWQLQFSSQVPVGYVIRVWGMGFYPDLANDTDILPLSGRYQRKALSWLYNWAQAKLAEWSWDAFPTGDAKKAHERKVEHMQAAKAEILEHMKQDVPGRIVTPMNQMRGPAWSDPSYLGSFSSGGIRNAPFNPVP